MTAPITAFAIHTYSKDFAVTCFNACSAATITIWVTPDILEISVAPDEGKFVTNSSTDELGRPASMAALAIDGAWWAFVD